MRFLLKFYDGKLHFLTTLRSVSYRAFGNIEFVIDTGSGLTFLGEKDASRFNISPSKLEFIKIFEMGGRKFNLFKGKESTLNFKSEENKLYPIKLENTFIAIATDKKEESRILSQSIPAIIGTDFLLTNKLSLYFNPNKNIAFLEKEE